MRKINNKGQVQTFIFVIASIFAVAVILFFFNHLFDTIYTEFDNYLGDSEYNDSEAHQALQTYQIATNSAWDYAFLGITIGYLLLLIITAFSTRISVVFYWIYILFSLVGFLVGILLSNTWQAISSEPVFAETLARFPITDLLLGTYFPTFMILILSIFLIVLFGKPGGSP